MIKETNIKECRLLSRGKVRDIYEFNDNLLIITTDRISAFDYILNQTVPDKGKVLNQIALFFFEMTEDIIENHLIHADFKRLPDFLKKYEYLTDRFVVVKTADPLPVECIIRGYKSAHTIGGMQVEQEMVESEKFIKPLFTPSTKAVEGHDENITFDSMKQIIGNDLGDEVKIKTEKIFEKCTEYALKKDIIIADTKMEFGLLNNKLIIIDELLTPDSSRFWDVSDYEKGRPQKSYDKQYIRDYLLSTDWDRNSAPPDIPDSIIKDTTMIYRNIFRKLTGNELS